MPVYKIFPESDTTLYSAYPTQNSGLDEILEVSVKNGIASSTEDIRRSIVQFNSQDLQTLQTLKSNKNFDVYLRMYLANAENLDSVYGLLFNEVDTQWSMGVGKFSDDPITVKGASWYNTGSYTASVNNWPNPTYHTVPGGGSWAFATVSQSFSYRDSKDINVKVTSFFNNWINGYTNAGIIIRHSASVENNANAYKVLNFFSGDTHTIYPPCLEMRWDDTIYNTGSLSVIDNTNTEITIVNNPYNIKYTTDKYTFKVAARDKYPARTFSTSSIYLTKKALPSSSYWAIQDVKTEDMVIDFDTSYTKIGCDATSSFFDVYMNGLEPERYYKLLIKYRLNSGENVVVDNNSIFKIVR
jgi:hypothetical protein